MTEHNPPIPWDQYYAQGRERAEQLGNRGPLRFRADQLAHDIVDAYRQHGFYVFTQVYARAETDGLISELNDLISKAPIARDSPVDKLGRPSRFAEYFSVSNDDPAVVSLVSHPIMLSDAALHAYAHPQILRMAASINGPDFVPFHEAIHYKAPNNGLPTRWHQDGRTHWTDDGEALEQADGSGKTHGFNLSVACSRCTPENCLWVIPGSQRRWLLANGGKFPAIEEQLPRAVPVLMEPGDCVIVNRSSLHGSYPNRTPNQRMTLLLGYHKRNSAIGTSTTNVHAFVRPGGPEPVTYSEEHVLKRARMIALAIDARRQRYPDETPYEYMGAYLGSSVWNDTTRLEVTREGAEYWRRDITL